MPPKFSLLKFLRSVMEGGADKGPTDFCLQDYGIEISKLQDLVELSMNETETFFSEPFPNLSAPEPSDRVSRGDK